jgi:hypothetical protein
MTSRIDSDTHTVLMSVRTPTIILKFQFTSRSTSAFICLAMVLAQITAGVVAWLDQLVAEVKTGRIPFQLERSADRLQQRQLE